MFITTSLRGRFSGRSNLIFKSISLVLVCAFLASDISWAAPSDYNHPQQSTLAPELRLKPFSIKHGLDFNNVFAASYMAAELRKLFLAGTARPGQIISLNKRRFPNGEVEINPDMEEGTLSSGNKWALAEFNFKNESKRIKVLLLKDYTDLTPQDLDELTKFKIKNDIDIAHLSCPGLEGVWFINPDKAAEEPQKSNDAASAIDELSAILEKLDDPKLDPANLPKIEQRILALLASVNPELKATIDLRRSRVRSNTITEESRLIGRPNVKQRKMIMSLYEIRLFLGIS